MPDTRSRPPKVLIVDDHLLFAEAIQVAMRAEGVEDVAIVQDSESALERMRDPGRRADVVLMDLGIPHDGGIAAGARIAGSWPETKVLALTGMKDPVMVREAMKAGFSGYLTKDTPIARLVNAMRTASDGQVVIPRSLARSAMQQKASPDVDDDAALLIGQLTDREREVLQLLAEGATSEAIADAMNIKRNTVRTHVQSILGKLGVHTRLEAAAFAVRHGVVSTRQRRSSA